MGDFLLLLDRPVTAPQALFRPPPSVYRSPPSDAPPFYRRAVERLSATHAAPARSSQNVLLPCLRRMRPVRSIRAAFTAAAPPSPIGVT